MTMQDRTAERARTAELLERALGPRWRVRVARALELDNAAVRRWFTPPKGRNDAPPIGVQAVAEFLDATPPAHWPARWK